MVFIWIQLKFVSCLLGVNWWASHMFQLSGNWQVLHCSSRITQLQWDKQTSKVSCRSCFSALMESPSQEVSKMLLRQIPGVSQTFYLPWNEHIAKFKIQNLKSLLSFKIWLLWKNDTFLEINQFQKIKKSTWNKKPNSPIDANVANKTKLQYSLSQ